MIKHAKTKHPDKYAEYEGKSQICNKQSILNLQGLKIKELNTEKTRQITHAIAKFITLDMRPINIIEGEGFLELLKILEPRFQLPSRTMFSETIIPQYYKQMKSSLIEELNKITYFSLTFDYWSSIANKSYLTITIHFLDY